MRFILIMVCYSAPECSNSCAKGYRLLDSFLMVPEKQFGFRSIHVTSGVESLLLDSVRLVISLFVSRKVHINNVIKRHNYLNSDLFYFVSFSCPSRI